MPDQIDWAKDYADGLIGCVTDSTELSEPMRRTARWERDAFRRETLRPRFETHVRATPGDPFVGSGKGKRALLYINYMKLDKTALTGNQGTGSCVGWACRGGGGCLIGSEIAAGEPHRYKGRPGIAVIYGSRGHTGQGMSVWRAARVVTEDGVQLMIVYCDGKYDLRSEGDDEGAGMRWGRTGPPRDILDAIKGNVITTASEVNGIESAMDALYNGYPIQCGSSRTAYRTGDPISRYGSLANHSEAIIGYDDTDEFRDFYRDKTGKRITGPVFIWDQSWGNWNTVTNWPPFWGSKPQGVFVLTGDDTRKKFNPAIAYSNFEGFPRRVIDWDSALSFL